MKKSLFVTGLTGFVGRSLQRFLDEDDRGWRLIDAQARYDLLQPDSLDAALGETCPDAVIHLAGQTFVPESFRDPARTLEINLLGTLNLLQALKRRGFAGTFLYISSGDVYGKVEEDQLPVREEQIPCPRNPYGVSKVAAELLCRQWSYAEPWRIMVARPFNHIGAGQGESFVIPSVAQQIARMRLGLQAPRLEVGDIDVSRDFLDVRDVLGAYFALLERGENGGIYNICSGREYIIRDLIQRMAALSGVDLEIVQDPARMRRAEQRRVCGSFERLHDVTGWQPTLSIEETLKAVLSDWESREKRA
ncbi:GDP-mannose 4,6-dehydratase [Pseudomonas sp. RIT-PI-AD]|uniref:GDP-mannose 4,6-dehydratase n=1 Tax=Pseudomonas sp. RIT-PI-AD TaxID=3035294 RepID=UPI0021DA932F|nr:GDP-mannose 4,6-dehydratase [Pseudomonas sp. RIT-PI-AD]